MEENITNVEELNTEVEETETGYDSTDEEVEETSVSGLVGLALVAGAGAAVGYFAPKVFGKVKNGITSKIEKHKAKKAAKGVVELDEVPKLEEVEEPKIVRKKKAREKPEEMKEEEA